MYTHGYGSRLHTELQLQFDPHNLDCPGKEHEHLHAIGHDHYDLHHRRRGRGGGTADAVHQFDPDGGGRLNQHPRGHLLAAIRPNEAVWGTAAGTTSHDVRNGLIRIIQNNFLQNQQSANLLGVAFFRSDHQSQQDVERHHGDRQLPAAGHFFRAHYTQPQTLNP